MSLIRMQLVVLVSLCKGVGVCACEQKYPYLYAFLAFRAGVCACDRVTSLKLT